MNRHFLKISVLVVVLVLAMAFCFTGCKADDVEANLDSYKTENAEKIASLEAALKEANDKNAALNAEVEALTKKVNGLHEDIMGDINATINSQVSELASKVAAAEKAIDDLEAALDKAATAADLEAVQKDLDAAEKAIDDLEADLAAVKDEYITIAGFHATTEEVYAGLNSLDEKRAEWLASVNLDNYTDDQLDTIDEAYTIAKIKILRAVTVGDIADAIDGLLDVIADQASARDRFLANVLAIKDKIIVLADEQTIIDLRAEYDAYVVVNGDVSADTDVVAAEAIIANAEAALVDLKVLAGDAEAIVAILGGVTVDTVEATKAFGQVIIDYRTQAGIETVITEGENGLEVTYSVAATGWLANYDAWRVQYFADVAVEGENAEYNNTNLAMIGQANFEAIFNEFVAQVEAYVALALDYIAAVEALPDDVADINILTGADVEVALDAYDAWTKLANVEDYDYVMEVITGKGAEVYYTKLITIQTAYAGFIAEAKAAWLAVAPTVAGLTTDNVTIYNTTIAPVLAWFTEYAAWDNGAIVWSEGDIYDLGDDVIVTAADYANVVALNDTLTAVVAGKAADAAAVQAIIDALADDATLADREAVEAARAAYEAYLLGNGNTTKFDAAQTALNTERAYNVDITKLEAAEAKIDVIDTQIADIHAAIEALETLEQGSDAANPYYSTSVVFAGDRTAYIANIAAIEAAIANLGTINGGDTTAVTEAELAKIATCKFYEVKADAVLEVIANYLAVRTATEPTNPEKIPQLETAFLNSLARIDVVVYSDTAETSDGTVLDAAAIVGNIASVSADEFAAAVA